MYSYIILEISPDCLQSYQHLWFWCTKLLHLHKWQNVSLLPSPLIAWLTQFCSQRLRVCSQSHPLRLFIPLFGFSTSCRGVKSTTICPFPLTSHDALQFYSYCVVNNKSLFFSYDWLMFHCAYMPRLLYSFISHWARGLFPYPGYCT